MLRSKEELAALEEALSEELRCREEHPELFRWQVVMRAGDENHYFVVEEGIADWGAPFDTLQEAQAVCNIRNGISQAGRA